MRLISLNFGVNKLSKENDIDSSCDVLCVIVTIGMRWRNLFLIHPHLYISFKYTEIVGLYIKSAAKTLLTL